MQHEEIEVKFLDIDVALLEDKLAVIGATKKGELFQRNHIFDYPGWPLDAAMSWVRLRDNGEKKTLSFKRRVGVVSVDGKANDETAEEIEVSVDDIEKTKNILYALGMVDKRYMENKRIRWKRGSVVFDIDFWPRLPPYVEIEGESMEEVEKASLELGFDFAEGKIYSAQQAFKHYGIDPNDYTIMTFEKFIRKDGTVEML